MQKNPTLNHDVEWRKIRCAKLSPNHRGQKMDPVCFSPLCPLGLFFFFKTQGAGEVYSFMPSGGLAQCSYRPPKSPLKLLVMIRPVAHSSAKFFAQLSPTIYPHFFHTLSTFIPTDKFFVRPVAHHCLPHHTIIIPF